jgi:hypothetical protein
MNASGGFPARGVLAAANVATLVRRAKPDISKKL